MNKDKMMKMPDKKKGKDIFEKKPKESPKAKPAKKKGAEEEETLYEAVDGKIKEGGLHRSLKVDKDYTFKRPQLLRLLKMEVGDSFKFEGNQIKMTEKIRKQLQLAVNMMRH